MAQIPLGAITIAVDLHPLAVMAHFLLALVVLALTVVVVLEAWSHAGGLATPAGPGWLRRFVTWVGIPACAALVVTGAVATASGPHPGADEDVKRLGLEIVDTVYVHVRVAAAFGIGVLFIGWFLVRMRDRYPGTAVALGRASRRSRRASGRRRGAVPDRASVGPRPRARLSRRRDLGAERRGRVRALAAARCR